MDTLSIMMRWHSRYLFIFGRQKLMFQVLGLKSLIDTLSHVLLYCLVLFVMYCALITCRFHLAYFPTSLK